MNLQNEPSWSLTLPHCAPLTDLPGSPGSQGPWGTSARHLCSASCLASLSCLGSLQIPLGAPRAPGGHRLSWASPGDHSASALQNHPWERHLGEGHLGRPATRPQVTSLHTWPWSRSDSHSCFASLPPYVSTSQRGLLPQGIPSRHVGDTAPAKMPCKCPYFLARKLMRAVAS